MKKLVYFLFLIFPLFTNGQIVKMQLGPTFSALDTKFNYYELKRFNHVATGFSFFLGVDYFNTPYFSMSSNIGFLGKGGKEKTYFKAPNGIIYPTEATARLTYFTFNTGFNLKYPATESIAPFFNILPRIDLLMKTNDVMNRLPLPADHNKINLGLALGGGIQFLMDPIVFGFKFDYYLNLKPIAEWPDEVYLSGGTLKDHTLVTGLFVGLKFN